MILLTDAQRRDPLAAAFHPWAEPWARLGLWLSLWDSRANLIRRCEGAGSFWEVLVRHSVRCGDDLRRVVCQALGGRRIAAELSPCSGIAVHAVPIFHRLRVVGAVLMGGLTPELSDPETFARFCSVHGVDRQVFERLAAKVPRYDVSTLDAYADILSHHAGCHYADRLAQRDIRELSDRLARAYEELSLIYRVSSGLTMARRPAEVFHTLCVKLAETTVVKSFAAVLDAETVAPPALACRGSADGEATPSVVTGGPLPITPVQVLRLYHQVREGFRHTDRPLVVNDVRRDQRFAWIGPHLRRFVFFDLSRRGRTFGGLLAIDRDDDQDFTSEEIQLVGALAERGAAFLENACLYRDLEDLFLGMLHALVSSIDAKDPYTCGHSQRVAWLSRHVAGLAGLPEHQAQRVYLSGLLHDIGKIGIPDDVLSKAGRLTLREYEQVKRHPQIGARILEGVPQVKDLLPGVLHHHERVDGAGYQAGLKGHDVPLLGRIIGLADSFDAMTTERTYRPALPLSMAAAEIRRCSGTQFDPALAGQLLADDLQTITRRLREIGRHPIRPPTAAVTATGRVDFHQRWYNNNEE